jgi:hypothetical protein
LVATLPVTAAVTGSRVEHAESVEGALAAALLTGEKVETPITAATADARQGTQAKADHVVVCSPSATLAHLVYRPLHSSIARLVGGTYRLRRLVVFDTAISTLNSDATKHAENCIIGNFMVSSWYCRLRWLQRNLLGQCCPVAVS